MVEKVPINNLVLNKNNPRTIKKEDFDRLKKSLENNPALFEDRPVIASNRTGENIILCGNTRYRAAKELGWKEVPASIRTLTEDEEREWIIRDNINNGEWDWDILANEWDREELEEWGVDVPEMNTIDEEVEEDDCDTTSPKEPITKRGDIYMLGEHRVMCGDSTMIDDVEKLMDGEKADMVFTDPPYNIASDSKNFAETARPSTYKKLKESEWDKNFNIKPALDHLSVFSKNDGVAYVCTSHFLFQTINDWADQFYKYHNYVVWCKPNPTPSLAKRHWTWATELIVYATRGKHTCNFPKGKNFLNFYGNEDAPIESELEMMPGMSYWILNKESHTEGHPTQKPVKIAGKPIVFSSKKEDIVMDLFLGSGSTLMACEQTGRKCYGMELDERYVDVIVRRYIKHCKDNNKEPLVKLNGEVVANLDKYE